MGYVKPKLLGLLALVLLSGSVQATTYEYTGLPFTSGSCTPIVQCSSGVGANVTAEVAFDFDTSAFSGTLTLAEISSADLFSTITGPGPGTYPLPFGYPSGAGFNASLTLVDGAITGWDLDWNYHATTTSIDVSTSSGGDAAGKGSYGVGSEGSNDTPGTWACEDCDPTPAETPLPAGLPLFATGLGALGLLGWRRRRKAGASLLGTA